VGYFVNMVTGVASSIATGVARTEFEMKYAIFMVPLNLLLSIILIFKFGLVGLVTGTSISLILGSFYFLRLFHKYLNIYSGSFFRLLFKPVIACIIPALITIILNYDIWPIGSSTNRIVNLSILGANSILFVGIYIIFILSIKYFDNFDMGLFRERIPILGYILK